MKETIKIFVIALVIGIIALAMFCAPTVEVQHSYQPKSTQTYKPSDPGGIGMTFSGKMGIDLGGGLILPFDSKEGIGFGFGF